jgi:hypothetical protein
MFRRFALTAVARQPRQAAIFNPFWGDHGASFAWDLASIPSSGFEAFGAEDDFLGDTLSQLPQGISSDSVLLKVAQLLSLEAAVDLLWDSASECDSDQEANQLADLAVRVSGYVDEHPEPNWVDEVSNDDAFISELAANVSSWTPHAETGAGSDTANWEAFGGWGDMWERLGEKSYRIRSAFSRGITTPAVRLTRYPMTRTLATFTGDIFKYLAERGTPDRPGPIVDDILRGLSPAADSRTPDDEALVVIAHSLGGVIMYDILTAFEPSFHVDALVTVGSQVALFEEMKLFLNRDVSVHGPSGRIRRPAGVKHWLNVFDLNDVLAFQASAVFGDVVDFSYSTGAGVKSHGTYFALPSFHRRLRARLSEVFA